jgi:cGMP-dependent protein kinase
LFEQSQPARYFFVLVTGKMEVLVNTKRVNLVDIGSGFGELALLHDTPRSATIKSIERCTLWGLDRKSFRSAVASVNALNYMENKTFIDSVPLLQVLTNDQKDTMVAALTSHKFMDAARIVNEGDPGDLFYIIKDGTVSCT